MLAELDQLAECCDAGTKVIVVGRVNDVILYRELLKLARKDPLNNDGWLIYPMPKQHEIARRAATTRETVARVLANLLHGGQVTRKDKTYYLTDRAALEQAIVRLDVRQGGHGLA